MENENNLPLGHGGEMTESPTSQPPSSLVRKAVQPREEQAVVSAAFSQLPAEPQPARRSQPSLNAHGQMQIGASASQLGLNQPNSGVFDFSPK